ncbi:MAG: rod shape-determining protein MreC [Xanthomonadaceae bacterium]|nr:rod shape-determining protein MreC [Xanthomonadaceae bacterium]
MIGRSDPKPLFLRGPSLNTRLFVCAIASVVLMTVDHRQNHLDNVRDALSVVLYPVPWLVDAPFRAAHWTRENLASRRVLVAENSTLRDQLRAQATTLLRYETLEAENRRLRALLQSAELHRYQAEVAGLLSVDLDPFRHQLVLNRGERDGVVPGQALIDAHGVMGQVHRVNPLTSHALLITDPSHALPVEVNRNSLRTIVRGTGELDRLELPYLPNNADIEVGDLLVTSGLGGKFPAGYPVAIVTAVTRRPGERFAEITASPTALLNRSREVLLVRPDRTPPPQLEEAPQ